MATVPRLRRYYRGATTSCSARPSAYWFASRLRRCLRIRVRHCAPAALQARRRAGIYIVHAGHPPSSDLAHGQKQDLPGFLAPHPVTLRRSTTPDDPSRLAARGASGAAPRLTTLKASSLQLSRLTATLRHPLSTLHDGRCRTPCKTRFRLAGCTFAGRESNPLGSVERFQINSSSFPGLRLAPPAGSRGRLGWRTECHLLRNSFERAAKELINVTGQELGTDGCVGRTDIHPPALHRAGIDFRLQGRGQQFFVKARIGVDAS